MLFLSLLAIAALAVLPDVAFQIKRDREEEMIHRGLGYERGIRRFYKKFGRYPTRIEELEDTNHFRFIRKRYKDPVNKNQDFKILRMGDVALGNGMMLGATPNAGQGINQKTATTTATAAGDAGNSSDAQTNSNSDSSSSSSSSDTSSSTQQVFGGGPMLGVVSANKGPTIREFCSKSHYKDWYFIYDPTTDRGGTLNSPWCPLQNQGFGAAPPPNPGTPSPPNTGAPGTVPTTPSVPNPNGDTAIQQ